MKSKQNKGEGDCQVLQAKQSPAAKRKHNGITLIALGDGTLEGNLAAIRPYVTQSALVDLARTFGCVPSQDTTTPAVGQLVS